VTLVRSPERSVIVFGVYLALVGFALLAVPGIVLALVGMPQTSEPWIRVVGILAYALGYYFVRAGRNSAVWFMRTSVEVRILVPVSFGLLVLVGFAPATLLAFAVPDLAGAAWTAYALRATATS
jgi:hypothetical protein